ncbi:translation initiation factor IF-2 [Candidatus Berkelbacteria bacterium]|nr:translation initiation factor IF-2 [Candidatus Berkelbacteria bacterium]
MSQDNQITIGEEISLRSLASQLNVDPTVLISKLVQGGVMANINQNLDYDTASLIAEEFGYSVMQEETTSISKTSSSKDAVSRPPIVTIMGHVDHGKTSLLDFIRKANVAAGESGGITQHISAYQIEFTTSERDKRKITFIDTPGHEAFSALRSHGATLTDIVVLVVAADDGIKPQTVEVIEHAKKANVQLIVAINKCDLPNANPDRVKQQLSDQGLVPEEWGGKTVIVPVSAKNGEGVNSLLDLIILTADLLDLKADPDSTPEGIVIEANLDKQIGPTATVLVYNGTLKPGQVMVVGKTYGRIRALQNDLGVTISSASPAMPVKLIGLKDVPSFGDRIEVVPNEKVARSMTQNHGAKGKLAKEGENTYPIIIKADVGGSLAALEDSIKKLKVKDATIDIVQSGIGPVTENDIKLAAASSALLISFRVQTIKRLIELAQKENVEIKDYWIIYDAIEFLQSELKRIATPVFITVEIGRLKVLEIFSSKAKLSIIGGEVTQGEIHGDCEAVIYRDKEEIGKAKVSTIRTGKLEAKSVASGTQCGMEIASDIIIEKGDVIAFIESREEK